MAVEHVTAVGARSYEPVNSHGFAANVKGFSRTLEVPAASSANSTFTFGRIPSNARILGLSRISFDDLASTGSPTFDIGLFAVDGNITSDDDALNDGIDVASAAATVAVVKGIENYGLPAWDYVSGQASDPGGELEIKVTLKDAATNTGGTATIELLYIVP